jgi:acyl-CoA reductase-like NAD-dependent aldehyde dehydrogenase
MTDQVAAPVREALPLVAGEPQTGAELVEFRDPYRHDVVSRVARSSPAVVDLAVQAARAAQPAIAAMPVAERAEILRRTAALIEERSEAIATTISREIGKALKSTRREVLRSSVTLRAAAAAAETLEGSVPSVALSREGVGLLPLAVRVPVGVVGAITPFNAPFNLVVHKVAPSFAVGNATVVKPASQTALTAVDLLDLLRDAGAPSGAFSLVPGGHETVDALVDHPGVDAFTFTGGRAAATAISRKAGTRHASYELGGNSPNIVHRDADLELAARECVTGGFRNTGQSCNSVQRIFVHRDVAQAFTDRLVALAAELKVGDPLDPETDIGTLVNEAAAERVERWIHEARAGGARVLLGGERSGALLQPTIVTDIADDARLVCEEVFGPVVVILPYDSLDEAIRRANASEFGLMAAIFTTSLPVALEASRRIEAGGVLVNRSTNFRLDQMPYGGIKESGIGREGPRYAMEELSTLKLVLIDPQKLRPED